MKITILGSGTSTGVPQIGCRCATCTSTDPRDKRLRCSIIIETDNGTHILIDCSADFRQQMLTQPFEKIDAVLITHEHYDHVGGLDDLRPYCAFGDIEIYAEQDVCERLEERIPYCFTPKEKRYPGVPALNLNPIAPHEAFTVNGTEILPLRVMHGKLPILGFRIGDFAYITDMTSMTEEDVTMVKGVKTLIINALRHEPHSSHQTVEQAIEVAHQIGASETYLTHMSHNIKPHAMEDALLPPNVHLAYDGLKIAVK